MKFDTEICKGISCPECSFNKGEDGCLLAERLDEIEIIPEPCEDAVSRRLMYELGATCMARRDENGELVALGSLDMLPSVQSSFSQSHENDHSAEVSKMVAHPEPCEDAVSRKDVVEFLDDWMSALNTNCHQQSMADLKIIKKDFENLSSVTPKQRWIPCSERLPEEYGNYLITTHDGNVDIGTIDPKKKGVWSACDADGFYWLREVNAWMPLPEPYREEGGE